MCLVVIALQPRLTVAFLPGSACDLWSICDLCKALSPHLLSCKVTLLVVPLLQHVSCTVASSSLFQQY